MTRSELISVYTFGGFIHCLLGDCFTADFCWRTGVEILGMSFPVVGEA